MARPSNTGERRAQITGALMTVMSKQGYDGATIADIAKVAHLTPGLVHYHFKNKHEILLAALHDLTERHRANLESRLERAGGDPLAEVAAFIDVHLSLGKEADPEALACWILLSGEALRDKRIRTEYENSLKGIVARIANIIRRGVEQKVLRCESIDAAASALVALIQGYFVLAATARASIPRGSAAGAAKRMAGGLLQPARPFAGSPRRR